MQRSLKTQLQSTQSTSTKIEDYLRRRKERREEGNKGKGKREKKKEERIVLNLPMNKTATLSRPTQRPTAGQTPWVHVQKVWLEDRRFPSHERKPGATATETKTRHCLCPTGDYSKRVKSKNQTRAPVHRTSPSQYGFPKVEYLAAAFSACVCDACARALGDPARSRCRGGCSKS